MVNYKEALEIAVYCKNWNLEWIVGIGFNGMYPDQGEIKFGKHISIRSDKSGNEIEIDNFNELGKIITDSGLCLTPDIRIEGERDLILIFLLNED